MPTEFQLIISDSHYHKTIRFQSSADDLACKLLSHIAAVSGSMMWLINQTGTLKQICGEITRRLRQSTEFTRWQGLIEISTELGADFIEIDNG